MPTSWNKLDRAQPPTMEQATALVDSPLWAEACEAIEALRGVGPRFEYSGCSVPGWNLKYRKSGRALCTLYPMEGYFIALVVIGNREKHEFDLLLPALTSYTRELYERTKDKHGLCWLMFEVRDRAVLADMKQCMALRI